VFSGELVNLILTIKYNPVKREYLNLYFRVPFLIIKKGPIIFRRLKL
jgi:hypothetical protein